MIALRPFGRLRANTWFCPGHGNDSALGKERPAIPELAYLRLASQAPISVDGLELANLIASGH